MRNSTILLLAASAFAGACNGNPADQFVGSYTVSGTTTFSNTLASTIVNEQFTISESENTAKIIYNDAYCNVSAVASGSTFTINQLTCPAFNVPDPKCSLCTVTLSYTGGTGSLEGNVLTVSGTGSFAATCSACPGPLSGTFTETFSGPKS
jgi:hypothetical protein